MQLAVPIIVTSVTRGGIMSMSNAKNGAAGVRAFTATAMKTPVVANSVKISQQSLRLKPSMFKPAPVARPHMMKAAQAKLQHFS